MINQSDFPIIKLDSEKVEQAVAAWIRAEWYFRAGGRAYTEDTANNFEKATVKLRRALTGKGELDAAFQRIRELDNAQG